LFFDFYHFVTIMESQKIDRLSRLDACESIRISQKRKGLLQEIIGCEAKSEFKWYDTTGGGEERFAKSKEDSSCCIRFLCGGAQPYTMTAELDDTDEELMTMDRPFKCPVDPCKCCCYQEMTFSVEGQKLGKMKEEFFCCVPRFSIEDGRGDKVYKVHPPTCCGGMCMDCCAEGNPCCGKGCCKVPFHVFPASQENTDNGAEYAGKILKVPKSFASEMFTDAESYDINFPNDATDVQKAMICGSAVLINSMFFEGGNEA
jgi:hypothetical protein